MKKNEKKVFTKSLKTYTNVDANTKTITHTNSKPTTNMNTETNRNTIEKKKKCWGFYSNPLDSVA